MTVAAGIGGRPATGRFSCVGFRGNRFGLPAVVRTMTLRSLLITTGLLVVVVSCGTETGSTSTTSTTSSRRQRRSPTVTCETGPAVFTGTVTWLSGGIAGFNQATIEPTECSVAGPVPIINLAFDAFPVAASSTDCEGCPDALTTTVSPVVAVHGVLVPATDLAGEDLAPGSLVLVADGRAQAPQQLRYRALDVPEITWDLRTRFRSSTTNR